MIRLLIIIIACIGLQACNASDESASNESPPLPWHSSEAFGPLTFSASAEWAGRESEHPIHARLIMRAVGVDTVIFETGVCGLGLRAYRDKELTEPAVWDDRPPPDAACADMGYRYWIAPSKAETIEVHELASRYASLPPPGHYYFAVVMKGRHGQLRRIPAGEVEVK